MLLLLEPLESAVPFSALFRSLLLEERIWGFESDLVSFKVIPLRRCLFGT